ncbi:histidinol-phosphate transaminase [Bacillus sp. CGMCC 1.16541]|uniref:histidinol-phosphate transaminase n=1 Tax=Bacillus sp. CGMCC 1.16541 TaxID=2185143 RepID=UPI000D727A24|nr:histidinol-phosphate transaminase [Bacillus sp. CGMCC 1.16541]
MIKSTILTRNEIQNLAVYVPGKPIEEVQRELGLEKVIKLASNENPFGCSPLAYEAMKEELSQMPFYPESMAPKLAERLSEKLHIEKDHFIFGNGSDEIIRLLTRSYIRHEDEVIMADVTFPRYETNVIIEGGKPVKVPLQEGVHHLEGMIAAITDKTRMIFVCNPNNPTGTIVSKEELQSFIERVPPHILLVLDEAYYEYVSAKDRLDTVALLKHYHNLILLRTFSKIYGLAASRIGYGMMHPRIVAELVKVKEPFNTNRIAQAGAYASLADDAFVQTCVDRNRKGLTYIAEQVKQLGLNYFPSHANFLMIHLDHPGDEVFSGLLKQGVIIRSGSLLGYPNTIRVTIGTQAENEVFIQALQTVLGKKGSL